VHFVISGAEILNRRRHIRKRSNVVSLDKSKRLRGYAERYDWLRKQFKDWAFSFCASFLYYEESDPLMQELHRKAISAFDGILQPSV